jgi:hypothetical protein
MTKTILRCVFLAASMAAVSIPASAGELKLLMQDGRVTINADNVSLRQILQEWARVGQTKIVNIEKLSGPNVTLQLNNVPEREALDIVLRSANGYIAAPRAVPVAGAAAYDRITIFMSTVRPPAQLASAPPPPTFQRPPQPDDDEPINVAMPPQMVNPVNGQYPGMPQGIPQNLPPQMQQQLMQQQMQQAQPPLSPMPGPLTSPRPGALPAPSYPGIPNPYQPQVIKPGGGPGGPGGN